MPLSILSRVKISSSQRWDLEDFDGALSDLRTDSKLFSKNFISDTNQVISGFICVGIGLNNLTVLMSDSALLLTENTTDFSYFTAPPVATDIIVPDGDLVDGARNFLEIQLQTIDETPITRAFWDSNASGGLGQEFNQIVNTVTSLRAVVVSLQGGFSGSPDAIRLAIVDVSPTGQVTTILDQRPLFGRLAQPSNLGNEFPWGTKTEPPYTLNLSTVVGVFLADEPITIGTETAIVVVGGTSPLTFKEVSGVNFFPGDTVTGGTSGATGTIVTVEEAFIGVDKNLDDQFKINQALQTEIKLIKGTPQWYADAGATLSSVSQFLNTVLVGAQPTSRFFWDGTNLTLTDDAAIPTNSDSVALLRQMGKATDMTLTRQSSGQESQTITFSNVPDAGALTLGHNGDLSLAINSGDDASSVQTAVNATWASTVTVSGNFASGFVFLFDGVGDTSPIIEQSNTLTSSATPVTTTIIETQRGYAGGASIPIGLDQVLFIDIPLVGSRTFSDIGVGVTNYQVVGRAAFVSSASNYWVAFNSGGRLYVRGMGELEAGESVDISDPEKEVILATLTAQNTRINEDRGIKLTSGGTWSVVGNVLTNSATANILIPGSFFDTNQVAAQSLTFPNPNSVAFVVLDRSTTFQTFLSPTISDIDNVPISNDVLIIARRTPDGIVVGTSSFLLKDGEFLELDGALAEINRLLGQGEINPHEILTDSVRILGTAIPQLDGSTLHQVMDNSLMRFDGAVINFTTGQIFESDGVTPLGVNFTPSSIPLGEFLWYGLSINSGDPNAINENVTTVGVDIASSSNAVAGSSVLPSFCGGDIKLGFVLVQNNAGTIEISQIKRLGVGTGSSMGDPSAIRDIYENRLDFSLFQTVSTSVFEEDGDTFIDPTSTGSLANSCVFLFTTPGQTFLDLNNSTSTDFLNSESDLTQIELFVRWHEDAIDPIALYEISRDGGNAYQVVNMVQVGTDSNSFRGFHIFSEEASDQILEQQITPNASRELVDTGVGIRRAVQIPITLSSVMKTVSLDFNKVEAVAGNLDTGFFKIQLILDDAGNPSTNPNDIVSETPLTSISTISTGNSTELIDIPNVVKQQGSIVWVVISTDAAYKALFVTGVDALSIRVNTLTPSHTGSEFDGLTWSPIAEGWTFALSGRALDLRLRITSNTANVRLESYGLYYHSQVGSVANTGSFDIDVFTFLGDDNVTNFPLVNIQDPIPGLVEAFDETEGNAYLNGATTYQILGNTLIFAANFFNRPGQNLTLKVRQLRAGIIDNSDPNASAIVVNQTDIDSIRNNQDKSGSSGGGVNAYTLVFSNPFTSLQDGQVFYFSPIVENTGPSTLTVDLLPTKPMGVQRGGNVTDPLNGGELRADGRVVVQYDSITDDFLIIGGAEVGYQKVEDQGTGEEFRGTLNFTGAGVSVTDDGPGNRSNIVIPGIVGGNVAFTDNANNFTVQQNHNAGLLVDGQGLGVGVVPPADENIHCGGVMQADGGYHQPGTSAETLKFLRCRVSSGGGLLQGGGMNVVRNSLGLYTITYITAFAAIPCVVVSAESGLARIANTINSLAGSCQVEIRNTSGVLVDVSFNVIIVGIP